MKHSATILHACHTEYRLKISVIVLNWNRPQDTIAAVDSVLRQKYPDFEVIVWDNASADNSMALLRGRFGMDARVRIVVGDANYGVAGGRNRSFPLGTGEILLSLDSDAWFESTDALEKVAAAFQSLSSVGAISFEVKRPDGHLMWPFSRPAGEWKSKTFETIRVDGCAFAVRRELYSQIGGFAEHFSPYGAEDQHFALSLMGLGYRIHYMPSVVVVHAFSTTGRTALQFRRHVRNSLWIPIELFPFPESILRFGAQSISLFRDGREQKRVGEFFRGFREALTGFKFARRKAIPRFAWKHFLSLVQEDKVLAQGRKS